MVERDELERRIRTALPDAKVEIEDLTGGADHYSVTVVSAAFAGKPTIVRHRMVHAPLRDILGGALHALQLATKTPEEK